MVHGRCLTAPQSLPKMKAGETVAKRSAGILMYRRKESGLEVLLVHPGGPHWAKRDLGAWTIPKGEYETGEEALDAARREFQEETGFRAVGEFAELGTVRQLSGKIVSAWAVEGDCDPTQLTSNLCMVQWPPRSGRMIQIPEVDRGEWFSVSEADRRIQEAQREFLDRLSKMLERAG